jgi:hypothetical protein
VKGDKFLKHWISLSVVLTLTAVRALAATCESLATTKFANTVISIAESRPAGDFTPPIGQTLRNLPSFCRVAGSLHPSADSDVKFEVWMPASGWNGKFQGVGNGGFAGEISYSAMAFAVSHGYATASTDTGHAALPNNSAQWALRHPEKITDFGYRAIHETAVTAKAIIRAFNSSEPQRSYFNSCSNGGRQALMEAQRFPDDYDGIIAGAPANDWTHLLSAAAKNVKATLVDPASYISSAKLPAIQAAALAACDASDGVKDGVIENPRQCHFDPTPLLCNGPESDKCLTAPQLAALKTIYDGLRDSKGKQVFPGYSPGGEGLSGGWAPWITGDSREKSAMFSFSTQFFMNMVYDNPDWRYQAFDRDADMNAADTKLAGILNATNPDLSGFRRRGGKLIIYHGWNDPAIPGMSTVDYYESVSAKMGPAALPDFLRLYMAPGMLHCGGGDGPNDFGQGHNGAVGDSAHDVNTTLEGWVEKGTAPAAIIARKGARTRPLCVFPQVARWKGTGSTDDAANFVCADSK